MFGLWYHSGRWQNITMESFVSRYSFNHGNQSGHWLSNICWNSCINKNGGEILMASFSSHYYVCYNATIQLRVCSPLPTKGAENGIDFLPLYIYTKNVENCWSKLSVRAYLNVSRTTFDWYTIFALKKKDCHHGKNFRFTGPSWAKWIEK